MIFMNKLGLKFQDRVAQPAHANDRHLVRRLGAAAFRGNFSRLTAKRAEVAFKYLEQLFGTEDGKGFDGSGHNFNMCRVSP